MQIQNLSHRTLGFISFFGAIFFLLTLIFLHLVRADIDWPVRYVSDFANGPYGSLFLIAVLIHGVGNLALAIGLFKCFESHPLREWASFLYGTAAVILFGSAAFGMFVAGIFPIDPSGSPLSPIGFTHEVATVISFPLELAALFLFSIAFSRSSNWHKQGVFSLVLSVFAAISLLIFFVTALVDWMPGFGERIAFVSFLLWELSISWYLIRKPEKLII